jgi:pilus assembly protein Flp/PilA
MLASLLVYIMNYLPQDEEGQGMAEYGLILVLISIAAIVVMGSLGEQIGDTFQSVIDALSPAAPAG